MDLNQLIDDQPALHADLCRVRRITPSTKLIQFIGEKTWDQTANRNCKYAGVNGIGREREMGGWMNNTEVEAKLRVGLSQRLRGNEGYTRLANKPSTNSDRQLCQQSSGDDMSFALSH
jgi:hypothetical protein